MSEAPEVVLVLARAENGVIGREGGLPWRIPADLKHFKALTLGKPMVMGRKTFESLPGLLPGRRHIVLTRERDWHAEGAEVAHSIEEAIERADDPEIAVVGGAQIYAAALPHATRIELTEVHAAPEGDTLVPPFDPATWREIRRDRYPAEGDRPAFSFVTLIRAD